jgi:hypothetical protein
MPYDPEKYREKREKVLGKRGRGISFQTIAVVFTILLLSGFAFLVLPKVIASLQERNLEDVIYRMRDERPWPAAIGEEIARLPGVNRVVLDRDETRLIVTFDRTRTGTSAIEALFQEKDLETVLLNRMHHGTHREIQKEEREG